MRKWHKFIPVLKQNLSLILSYFHFRYTTITEKSFWLSLLIEFVCVPIICIKDIPIRFAWCVSSMSMVHIQAQSSVLQTLTSTFPGHWAFPVRIYPSVSTPWGVESRSHATWRHDLQICPHGYPFAPESREALQSKLPCSGAQRADALAGFWTRNLT